MPSFSTDGRCYFIAYITGPSHIRLGIEWATDPGSPIVPDRLPSIGGNEHGGLSEGRIETAVVAGVHQANCELGVIYSVARIVSIADDSPRCDLFREGASLLVEQHAAGRSFRHRESSGK